MRRPLLALLLTACSRHPGGSDVADGTDTPSCTLPGVEIEATPQVGRVPLAVHLVATGEEGGTATWTFPDGTTAAGAEVDHVFLASGEQQVEVAWEGPSGVAGASVAIEVEPELCPVAGTPVLVAEVQDTDLNEVSGAVASRSHPGVYWMEEDKGNPTHLYAIDETGFVLADYELPDDDADDLEDLSVFYDPATGKSRIYIADTGDNDWKLPDEQRSDVWFYVVDEPDVEAGQPRATGTLDYAKITLHYPDIPRDAEAMFVDPRTEDVYVATKDYQGPSLVFRKPAPHLDGEDWTLELVATLDLPGAQTAAAFDPLGDQVLIRGYGTAARIWLRDGDAPLEEVLAAEPCEVRLALEPQSESATYAPDGGGVYTVSEIPTAFAGDPTELWFTPLTPGAPEDSTPTAQ